MTTQAMTLAEARERFTTPRAKYVLDRLKENESGCWLWTLRNAANVRGSYGVPAMTARRAVLQVLGRTDLLAAKMISVTCGNSGCCWEAHCVAKHIGGYRWVKGEKRETATADDRVGSAEHVANAVKALFAAAAELRAVGVDAARLLE